MASLGSLGSLVIELAANTARLQSDMGKAVGIAQSAAGKLQSAFKFAGGGLLGGAVLGIAKQAIDLGGALDDARIKAGVSGRAISELAYAAKFAEVDLASLSTALQKMQVFLSNAATGGKAQNEALRALGLTFKELKELAPDKQFELIADRISQLKDPADRTRAAVELFGKSGASLLPLFEQGAAGIRKAREEAQRLGASFSDQQLKKLAEAGDAVDRLSLSWQSFATTLTAKVSPPLIAVLDALSGVNRARAQEEAGKNLALLSSQLKALERQRGSIKGPNIDTSELDAKIAAIRKKIDDLLQPIDTSQLLSQRGRRTVPGFEAAAEEAKAAATRITEAFELDPETLDRIAFEDWKRQTVENMDEVIRAGADMEDELSDYADEMANSWEGASESISTFADQAARNMQDAFADFLFDPFENGIKGMLKGFVDILRRMVAEAAAAKIFEALGFGQKSGGGGGIFDKLLGGLVGGGRNGVGGLRIPGTIPGFANGGSFEVGGGPGIDANLVAFRATRGERVTISKPGMGGGGVVIAPTYNIDARGATSELINALPEILRRRDAQLREDIIEGLRRGRY